MNNVNLNLISGKDGTKPCLKFEGVIGQTSVIRKLQFFLASHCPQTPFPSLLFTGSHGLGKTFVAKKLAANMHRRFLEVNCGTISTTKDLIEGFLLEKVLGEDPVTILFDEAHRLTGEVTTVLLTLLAPNIENKNTLNYKNLCIEYDMSKINVIFATTDAYRIFPALVDRSTRIYFEAYQKDDMLDMLRLYLPEIEINCNSEDISYACRGRGRDAFKLAQNILRYCNMKGTKTIGDKDWKNIKKVFEIYPYGLNRQEVELLKIVADQQPISSFNIAMQMMINEENIEGELEIRVRELALIKNTTKGRILTEDGEKYLGKRKIQVIAA